MNSDDIFEEGDPVLLIHKGKSRWLVKAEDRVFHFDLGKINLKKLIGEEVGSNFTVGGKRVLAVRPAMQDWIGNIRHGSQIVYGKDAAMISFLVDAQDGKVIYEAGTGSGFLTSVLARKVAPNGKVVTHEVRDEALQAARKNIERMGIENVEFNKRDVKEGFTPGTADGVVLDMVDPWEVIPNTTAILKVGGPIVLFQPTFNQLERCKQALEANNFKDIRVIELIEREIEVRPQATRPATRMIGHTGFLIYARYYGRKE